MSQAFESESGTYVALINEEEQFSLWPSSCDVPGGWQVVHGPASRQSCLDHIEQSWVDMRPRSLRERDGAHI